ncbi:MAG: DUF2889 domain-containing protein [Clostridia bacterium]|nr:DUF2889 domain-containing protein [Clostridia bacterium]
MGFYSRNLKVDADILDEQHIKITGTFRHKVESESKGEYFKVEVIVEVESFMIKDIQNVEMDVLFPICHEFKPHLRRLIGQIIGPGYSKKVVELIGGKDGCTHMVELFIEIGRCVFPAYYHGVLLKQAGLQEAFNAYKNGNMVQCLGLSNLAENSMKKFDKQLSE